MTTNGHTEYANQYQGKASRFGYDRQRGRLLPVEQNQVQGIKTDRGRSLVDPFAGQGSFVLLPAEQDQVEVREVPEAAVVKIGRVPVIIGRGPLEAHQSRIDADGG